MWGSCPPRTSTLPNRDAYLTGSQITNYKLQCQGGNPTRRRSGIGQGIHYGQNEVISTFLTCFEIEKIHEGILVSKNSHMHYALAQGIMVICSCPNRLTQGCVPALQADRRRCAVQCAAQSAWGMAGGVRFPSQVLQSSVVNALQAWQPTSPQWQAANCHCCSRVRMDFQDSLTNRN